MLKMTDIQLEKVNNIDVHLLLEKGIRDEISYISKRYSKSDENINITYWDANDLYCWAIIQDLPSGGFKFLSDKEINSFNLDSIAKNSLIGYILEVDLEYCKELHDSHSDYPLCPEKIEVSNDMLLKYCNDIADRYQIKVGGVKKLIPNLGDKFEYVVHYKNLKYYLSLGMKLVKIHRILSFKQSNWLKKYIDFNTDRRKQSTEEFKLMVNCIFGKSIQNIRKRINVELINNKKTYQKYVNKPNFVSQKILDKNFVDVQCKKTVLTLNKPIYVGFCILELSKLLMYQFHYDYIVVIHRQ